MDIYIIWKIPSPYIEKITLSVCGGRESAEKCKLFAPWEPVRVANK